MNYPNSLENFNVITQFIRLLILNFSNKSFKKKSQNTYHFHSFFFPSTLLPCWVCSNTCRAWFIRNQLGFLCNGPQWLRGNSLGVNWQFVFQGTTVANWCPWRHNGREKWDRNSPLPHSDSSIPENCWNKQMINICNLQNLLPSIPTQFYICFSNMDSAHRILYPMKIVYKQVFFF